MQISGLGLRQMPNLDRIAKLGQADPQLKKSIGVPSAESYTKEDAIISHYNRKTYGIDATLDELLSGKADIKWGSFVNPKDKDAYSKAVEIFRQSLEKNGLGNEINWDSVEYDLSSTDVGLNDVDQFSKKADYITSRYAVLQDRINTNYSGKALDEQMEKLNTLYSKAKELLANSYVDVVGSFLEKNGVENETANLRDSIYAGMNNRVKEYSDYLKSNRNYAQIDSDNDRWLLQDDGYMAAQLREKMDNSLVGKKTSKESNSTTYSLHDLDIAGVYVQQTSKQYESLENTGFIRNEESIGLELAVQSMKTDYLTKNSGTSNKMASLINRTFDGYMKNYLKKIDVQLKKDANHGMIPNGQKLFAPLNHSAVYDVYQYTMNQYQKSGDILQALESGGQYGKQQYDKKVDIESMRRYKSNILNTYNWDNFFQSKHDNPYALKMSDLQKYTITINYFKKSVDNGDIQNIDLMLGSGGDMSSNLLNYANMNQYEPKCNIEAYA